jgi:solute carrier family 25 (mitochondrial carnitine/acylcarnitine transporter), member 20/29
MTDIGFPQQIAAAAFSGELTLGINIRRSVSLLIMYYIISGLISSFVLNPIERVKILMQGDKSYTSEVDCVSKIVSSDGVGGLLLRGIDGMLIREVPGCVVYLLTYSSLMNGFAPAIFGPAASFFCGACAGVGAWIPIYPFDVVKTNMQNKLSSNGRSGDGSFFETANELRRDFGWGIFFEGIQPKLIRAAVHHSVTFFIFDRIVIFISSSSH